MTAFFCQTCLFLDAALVEYQTYHEDRDDSTSVEPKLVDLHLGCKSELVTRSSRCRLCRTLISLADELIADTPVYIRGKFLEQNYEFSAHLMSKEPLLWIAFGESPARPCTASERRGHLRELLTLHFFWPNLSGADTSGGWPAGRVRLFDVESVDTSLILKWMNRCKRLHGRHCQNAQAWLVRSDLRPSFIDVQKECIVTPTNQVPYAILSYLWGTDQSLQATKANIDELRQEGSLSVESAYRVPRTIRDSMNLCRKIGQSFLWVDRVCIVQDDYESKPAHLTAMAQFYAKAELTIVAANGPNADFGLAGLGQEVDERKKHLVEFPSRKMIRGTMWIAGTNRPSQTVWSTRGWTFQEHVFSRRLLFMDRFVNWTCCSARWAEAWIRPSEQNQSGLDEYGSGERQSMLDSPSLTEYASLVEQYNQREVTYDSDIMNAFAGVMTQMCGGFPAGFYGGNPEFYFDICLLWQPRRGLRPRFLTKETTSLPSWSWLGWAGSLLLDMWTCNTDSELPGGAYDVTISTVVDWFKTEDRLASSSVDNTYLRVRNHFRKANAPLPSGWHKHAGDADSGFLEYYTYNSTDYPGHIDSKRKFRYPVPPFQRLRDIDLSPLKSKFLFFRAQRAFFHLGSPRCCDHAWRWATHKDGQRYYAVDLPLHCGPASNWAGTIRVTGSEIEGLPPQQRCELIRIARGSVSIRGSSATEKTGLEDAISRASKAGKGLQHGHPFVECQEREELLRCDDEEEYHFFFVLWVEAAEDGTRRRKALGRVWEREWEGAGTEEVDVVLG
jgi:hypothetical protein